MHRSIDLLNSIYLVLAQFGLSSIATVLLLLNEAHWSTAHLLMYLFMMRHVEWDVICSCAAASCQWNCAEYTERFWECQTMILASLRDRNSPAHWMVDWWNEKEGSLLITAVHRIEESSVKLRTGKSSEPVFAAICFFCICFFINYYFCFDSIHSGFFYSLSGGWKTCILQFIFYYVCEMSSWTESLDILRLRIYFWLINFGSIHVNDVFGCSST